MEQAKVFCKNNFQILSIAFVKILDWHFVVVVMVWTLRADQLLFLLLLYGAFDFEFSFSVMNTYFEYSPLSL